MRGINAKEYRRSSQNGEDGIIAFLAGGLKENGRRFLEIGTSDGRENNTIELLSDGWSGVGIDGSGARIADYAQRVAGTPMAARITLSRLMVNWGNCIGVFALTGDRSPDFFSLDIDCIDYYIAHRLFRLGLRPAIICCEFNPFFGARAITTVYDEAFARYRYDPQRGLYFGASVAAWRHLFEPLGYRFIGVDSAGVNAFFGLEEAFAPKFLDQATGLPHAYTAYYSRKYGLPGEELERELLARAELRFIDVTTADIEALAGGG